MGRTVCLHYENSCNYIDNDPHLEEWYDYCRKKHCQICQENGLDCSTCKDYETGMHIATECIYYDNCIANSIGKCTDEVARQCIGYKEE